MTDWRQIQARIRKAKSSSDPAAQLADLYQRTHDAMVAFELAQWHEKAGNAGETVRWYTTAAQRFRRAQWRSRAEEALARLGAAIPDSPARAQSSAGAAGEPEAGGSGRPEGATESGGAYSGVREGGGIPYNPAIEEEARRERSRGPESAAAAGFDHVEAQRETTGRAEREGPAGVAAAPSGGKRRRGRRGGRHRRGRGGAGQDAGAGAGAQTDRFPQRAVSEAALKGTERAPEMAAPAEHLPEPSEREAPYERGQGAGPGIWPPAGGYARAGSMHGMSRSRAGEPGLSSRIAQLESQLRRLLACPMVSLEEAEQAPAGPGVLLLSDSDQVNHYYVEACQTLRIGVANLLRGGRGSKSGAQLKSAMAEHLGISDSKVSKYLKEHCGVRWIQLDEGAGELAHFAMAVLRPVVAE